jgi:hypothetical protein
MFGAGCEQDGNYQILKAILPTLYIHLTSTTPSIGRHAIVQTPPWPSQLPASLLQTCSPSSNRRHPPSHHVWPVYLFPAAMRSKHLTT